jgi:hypothetical protein
MRSEKADFATYPLRICSMDALLGIEYIVDVDIFALESRIEKLENSNRRMRLFGIIALIAVTYALFLSQGRKSRLIEAEQFALVDDKGNQRGGMTVTSQGPALELYDSNHTLRIALSIFNGSPNLTIKDDQGRGVAVLADVPSGPGLMLYQDGEPRAQLDVGKEGPRLYLEDERGFAATIGNYFSDDSTKNAKLTAASVVLSQKNLGTLWHAP